MIRNPLEWYRSNFDFLSTSSDILYLTEQNIQKILYSICFLLCLVILDASLRGIVRLTVGFFSTYSLDRPPSTVLHPTESLHPPGNSKRTWVMFSYFFWKNFERSIFVVLLYPILWFSTTKLNGMHYLHLQYRALLCDELADITSCLTP